MTAARKKKGKKKGKLQLLNTALTNKKQTALFQTCSLLLLELTIGSSTGFARTALGHRFQMKKQFLLHKNA